jgi:FtsP/CotA-like multicopper oxidase with cupredoxin domain
VTAHHEVRYCYLDDGGDRSPTLRLRPGDLLILRLKNEITFASGSDQHRPATSADDCTQSVITDQSTNLHFHGLLIPPACHQDESLRTWILPSQAPYEYRFQVPRDQPPGLYWYHPHVHGHSEEQVLGGASGAIIVEGIESAIPSLQSFPQRVLVIRDHPVQAPTLPDELGRPAKDLSVNFVPVPYPDYPNAVIRTKPSQRELWRVLNASADTYVDLFVLFDGRFHKLGLVAVDGVPLDSNSHKPDGILWQDHIPIPPGGRAEFVFATPAPGVTAELLTAGVETSPYVDEDEIASMPPAAAATQSQSPQQAAALALVDNDDYSPPRPLARIEVAGEVPELPELPKRAAMTPSAPISLSNVKPARQRTLYFSETVTDTKHPQTSTVFYITEEGHPPVAFHSSQLPNITVPQGTVEDWVIENRSQESHVFHIHQMHFQLLERDGQKVENSYVQDTIDVPYWDGTSKYPSVKLRMDFRSPAIIGVFPYHCHILQHADGGMMGLVRVDPARK